jgi:hypothetical protein
MEACDVIARPIDRCGDLLAQTDWNEQRGHEL